jgi:hypothetical protein
VDVHATNSEHIAHSLVSWPNQIMQYPRQRMTGRL